MSPEKKPNLAAIRIIPDSQVPPYYSRHTAVYEAVDAAIRNLQKGKALEINCAELGIRNSEVITHHIQKAKKRGQLPEVTTTCRATPNGRMVYISRPTKKEQAA